MTKQECKTAAEEIFAYTGNSSLGGAMSYLWDFLCQIEDLWPLLYGDETFSVRCPDQNSPKRQKRIAQEAADFKKLCGSGLSKQANALLSRICMRLTLLTQEARL